MRKGFSETKVALNIGLAARFWGCRPSEILGLSASDAFFFDLAMVNVVAEEEARMREEAREQQEKEKKNPLAMKARKKLEGRPGVQEQLEVFKKRGIRKRGK